SPAMCYAGSAPNGETEDLYSRSTWSLKLSGLVFAGLLILGRTATYGNVTWIATYHPASSPLQVLEVVSPNGLPAVPLPKSSVKIDPAAAVKRSAANEVLAFEAG